MSSNTEEDLETENINNINENKSKNNFDTYILNQENENHRKKSRNDKAENELNLRIINSVINIPSHNIGLFDENNINYNKNNKKSELSEDKKINNEDVLSLKNKLESLEITDKYNNKKLQPISPTKSKKKKKLIVLEEKKKYNTNKKSYLKDEKEERKEEKHLRKDKNGVPICRKNRRKVKISFEKPFVIETPIESYKKYNVIIGIPKEDNFINGKLCECQCCCCLV